MVKAFIIITLLFLMTAIFTYLFYVYRQYKHYCKNCQNYAAVKMKYKLIKQLYHINPSRWEIAGGYSLDSSPIRYTTDDYDHINIYPTFLGYLQLNYDKKNKKRADKVQKNNDALQTIIETSQRDIDKIRNQAKKEINQAKIMNEEALRKF